MFKLIKKSPVAFSVLMIMLCSFLFSTNEANAQSVPADVTKVCNILDKSRNLAKTLTPESAIEVIKTLHNLEFYRTSQTRLNSTSREMLTNSIFNLVKTLDPSTPNSMRQELRDETEQATTLGEVIKPFYDSLMEEFNKALQ